MLSLLLSSMATAEVVVLNSGQRIDGEIILQNEEVVIIKKKDGTRYQYPRYDILSIQQATPSSSDTVAVQSVSVKSKAVAVCAQLHGGAVYLPHEGWGGQVGADLLIGTKEIAGVPIFVGGSFGYRANIFSETNYSFLPLQAVVSMPLTSKQHAPYLGMSIGYGFSVDKTTIGGLCLSVSTGWMYHINANTSLLLSGFAEWQNARTEIIETLDGQNYTNNIGCNFLSIGAIVAIQF